MRRYRLCSNGLHYDGRVAECRLEPFARANVVLFSRGFSGIDSYFYLICLEKLPPLVRVLNLLLFCNPFPRDRPFQVLSFSPIGLNFRVVILASKIFNFSDLHTWFKKEIYLFTEF